VSAPAQPATDPARRPKRSERARSALTVVEPEARRRWVGVIGPIAVASLFGVLLAMAGLQALIVQGQTGLDRLDRELAEAGARHDRLLLSLAELESPDRVVAEARRLGMVDAPVVVYLTPTRPAAMPPTSLNPSAVELDR